MSKHQRIEHKDLLSVFSDLEFTEMMCLYIEAKTGDESNYDELPADCHIKIEQLDEQLNQFLGD